MAIVDIKKEVVKTEEPEEKNDSVSSKASSPTASEKSSSEKIDQKSTATSSISESKTAVASPLATATTTASITVTTSTNTPTTTASRFTTCTVTSPTSTTKPPLRRRHTTGPGMTFPATDPPTYSASMTFSRTSPLPSPHLDKRFFDSSLIEMKSQASSSSTLDYDSTEEVWVRRVDFVQERKRKVSRTILRIYARFWNLDRWPLGYTVYSSLFVYKSLRIGGREWVWNHSDAVVMTPRACALKEVRGTQKELRVLA